MSNAYAASDYAGFVSKNLDAYYGYEQTVGEKDSDEEEWAFVASVGGKEIARMGFSQLGARDQFNTGECLLKGLAILFDTHELKLNV